MNDLWPLWLMKATFWSYDRYSILPLVKLFNRCIVLVQTPIAELLFPFSTILSMTDFKDAIFEMIRQGSQIVKVVLSLDRVARHSGKILYYVHMYTQAPGFAMTFTFIIYIHTLSLSFPYFSFSLSFFLSIINFLPVCPKWILEFWISLFWLWVYLSQFEEFTLFG